MKSHQFISSLSYDVRLAPQDIRGSIAHARMLGRKKVIPSKDAARIIKGLESIARDLTKGKTLPREEDIHFAIERELIRRIGPAGGRLHTARSRNDQVATDLRLYTRDQIDMIVSGITRLQKAIVDLSERYFDVILPGMTHLQHAQPVLFSHHLLAYGWMLERDKQRFSDARRRVNVMPLGAAALAGTSFPIDRLMVAKELQFDGVSENSLDAVSDRDFIVEFLSAGAQLMSHLSRMAEELILWSSSEFHYVRIAEAFTSGSSIMPQKRNPDVAEIVRGETGRTYGNLVAMLTILKGLPLSYNRDLQEDKPPLFDTVDTLEGCLSVMTPMLLSLEVNRVETRDACNEGFVAATELADYLSEKGVPFREAHGIVQEVVRHCRTEKIRLDELTVEELREIHASFDEGALALLEVESVVAAKTSRGGTAPVRVREQLALFRKTIGLLPKKGTRRS